jgi:hypothetical protein
MAAVAPALDEGAVTRPLRRAHFLTWLVLAVALYVVFVSGLSARRSTTPRNSSVHWEQLR